MPLRRASSSMTPATRTGRRVPSLQFREGRLNEATILRRCYVYPIELAASQIFPAVAEHFEEFVIGIGNAAVYVPAHDAKQPGIEKGARSCFAGAQLQLPALALGHVLNVAVPHDISSRLQIRRGLSLQPDHPFLRVLVTEFIAPERHRPRGLGYAGMDMTYIVGMNTLKDRSRVSSHVLWSEPQYAGKIRKRVRHGLFSRGALAKRADHPRKRSSDAGELLGQSRLINEELLG